jgi:hypothetical protein
MKSKSLLMLIVLFAALTAETSFAAGPGSNVPGDCWSDGTSGVPFEDGGFTLTIDVTKATKAQIINSISAINADLELCTSAIPWVSPDGKQMQIPIKACERQAYPPVPRDVFKTNANGQIQNLMALVAKFGQIGCSGPDAQPFPSISGINN